MGAWRRFVVLRRVVVNLKSGQAIAGVLYRQAGALLILREAQLIEPGQQGIPLDGETIVERSEVLFIQAPGKWEG